VLVVEIQMAYHLSIHSVASQLDLYVSGLIAILFFLQLMSIFFLRVLSWNLSSDYLSILSPYYIIRFARPVTVFFSFLR